MDDVERYVDLCKKFDLQIDPSVVITLRSSWEILRPTSSFGEGALLPLVDVLKSNNHVKKLNLASSSMHVSRYRSAGNGNSNARLLGEILDCNSTIEEIDLSNSGIDDDGIVEICKGIGNNKTITKLNLSRNYFGRLGAVHLRKALEQNVSLKNLDLSHNGLGFQSINSLLQCCSPRGVLIQANGNFVFEEVLNSVSHGIAFLLSVVGSILLISEAGEISRYTPFHFWSCVL